MRKRLAVSGEGWRPVASSTMTKLKIYVADHKGMVGSAIVRQLLTQGHAAEQIITRSHAQLDLTNQAATNQFSAAEKPDQV